MLKVQNTIVKNYLPEIDCLRAIAILLVVFFHYELLGFQGGFLGVDIFFVISGYLISKLLTETKKDDTLYPALKTDQPALIILYLFIAFVMILFVLIII